MRAIIHPIASHPSIHPSIHPFISFRPYPAGSCSCPALPCLTLPGPISSHPPQNHYHTTTNLPALHFNLKRKPSPFPARATYTPTHIHIPYVLHHHHPPAAAPSCASLFSSPNYFFHLRVSLLPRSPNFSFSFRCAPGLDPACALLASLPCSEKHKSLHLTCLQAFWGITAPVIVLSCHRTVLFFAWHTSVWGIYSTY